MILKAVGVREYLIESHKAPRHRYDLSAKPNSISFLGDIMLPDVIVTFSWATAKMKEIPIIR